MDAIRSDMVAALNRSLASSGSQDWEQFVHATKGVIYASILYTLHQWWARDTQAAEDLVQEVYVVLHADDHAVLRRFRGGRSESLVAYLRTVAASVTVDRLRESVAQKRGEGKRHESIDELRDAGPHTDAAEEVMQRKILLRQIDECLKVRKKVQDRDRSIFWLHYRQGFTADAISKLGGLGLTPKGVESTILRLFRHAKDCVSHTNTKGKEG